MRLLHAETLEFEEFFDTQIPPYLILSHRWGEKEMSYKQINKKRAEEGPGLTKILEFCTLALEKNHTWVWIDTCCIDKKSSAELSEAINSMFKWYQSAEECVVYLSDVSLGEKSVEDSEFEAEFSASSWFTRGWTLQELLAPNKLMFYDTNWKEIGSKNLLCDVISTTTGIDALYITRTNRLSRPLCRAPMAVRMSWVARRETSRSEDMAYCLLGLFDVNMPLLYGEGAKNAFLRLQTEIIKESEDETIFAWTANLSVSGILATNPAFFANAGSIERAGAFELTRPRHWITNRGLALQVPRREWPVNASHSTDTEICIPIYALSNGLVMGIHFRCMTPRSIWCRVDCQSLTKLPLRAHKISRSKDQDTSNIIYIPINTSTWDG